MARKKLGTWVMFADVILYNFYSLEHLYIVFIEGWAIISKQKNVHVRFSRWFFSY